jgi:hypothetical protein
MLGLGTINGHMHTKQELETNYTLISMETLVGEIGGRDVIDMYILIIEDTYTISTKELI